jgi:hypothetical protein
MAWFRYYNFDNNYVYPNLRKKITFSELKENISKDSWIFLNVKDLDIDIYYQLSKTNSQFTQTPEVDPESYLVVYEDKSSEVFDFTPVKTHIVGDLLYFKAAEDHAKNTELKKQYSLYYKTPNLKLIKKRTQDSSYQSCEETESEFITSEEDVNTTADVRNINSNNYYNLSFINNESNWNAGVSKSSGASLMGTFTGPNLKVYCDKGPDYGKFKMRIISYDENEISSNEVILDWQEIDLYNQTKQENVLVFSKTNLLFKNYLFEIISNYEKNILSSDGKINIKSYSFSLNNYLILGKEEISASLLGRVVTGATL